MANIKLDTALEEIEMTYQELNSIATDMLYEQFNHINLLIDEITDNVNNLSVEDIRGYILRLSLKAYNLSEVKDKSSLKAELASAMRKESYARKYSEGQGTAGAKDTYALIEISDKIVAEALYNLVANLLKTKQDQIHRVVDSLKSVLMSRMQEAKLSMNGLE